MGGDDIHDSKPVNQDCHSEAGRLALSVAGAPAAPYNDAPHSRLLRSTASQGLVPRNQIGIFECFALLEAFLKQHG